MKINKNALPFTALVFALAAAPALADKQSDTMNMPGMQHEQMSGMNMDSGKGQTHTGQGTVTRVDAKAGKLGLKHGPIQSLNWPAMTMDFAVADPALLKSIRKGQAVHFEMKPGTDGNYVVTRVAPGK